MLARAEEAFSPLANCRHAIGFVNGTATLHGALEALGIGHGDEVIVPSLTMSATFFAVLQANATPIFGDVDPDTWQLCPKSLKSLIGPNTKAVMTVALYGGSPDYQAILEVVGKIPLIEDNAEAIGATYQGNPIGNFGAFSSYSFQSSKHLTAGEGGMLCTNSSELAVQARLVQTLGYSAVRSSSTRKIPKASIQDPSYLRHESLGWNYRMSEITAAVVLGQVSRVKPLLRRRREAAEALLETLSKASWLLPQANYPDSESSYWSVGATLERTDITWKDFRERFVANGGKGVYSAWALGYQEPALRHGVLLGRERLLTRPIEELSSPGTAPVAEELQSKILAFRTNEWSRASLRSQTRALSRTLSEFS